MSQTTPMRRKDRLITSPTTIENILKSNTILHLGLYDEDRIYVVPVNYSYMYKEGKLTFYFHGAKAGLKHDILTKHTSVGFEIDNGGMTITNETDPSQFTSQYESIIGSGIVTEITEIDEKKQVAASFMKHYSPKEWTITDAMVRPTAFYRLDVKEFQAKSNPRHR